MGGGIKLPPLMKPLKLYGSFKMNFHFHILFVLNNKVNLIHMFCPYSLIIDFTVNKGNQDYIYEGYKSLLSHSYTFFPLNYELLDRGSCHQGPLFRIY